MSDGVFSEFVVASTQVLHEGVSRDDGPRGSVGLQSAHWTQPRLEPAVIRFDSVIGVLAGVVERCRQQIVNDVSEGRSQVGHDVVGFTVRRECGGEERAG